MQSSDIESHIEEKILIQRIPPEAFIHTDDKKAICIKCNGIKEWVMSYRYSRMQTHEHGYWIYKHTDRNCKHIWRKLEDEGGHSSQA